MEMVVLAWKLSLVLLHSTTPDDAPVEGSWGNYCKAWIEESFCLSRKHEYPYSKYIAVAVVKSIKDGGEKIPTPILALSTVVCCGAWRGRVRRINCDAVTLIRLRNMWFHDNDMMEQRSTACYCSWGVVDSHDSPPCRHPPWHVSDFFSFFLFWWNWMCGYAKIHPTKHHHLRSERIVSIEHQPPYRRVLAV